MEERDAAHLGQGEGEDESENENKNENENENENVDVLRVYDGESDENDRTAANSRRTTMSEAESKQSTCVGQVVDVKTDRGELLLII